MGLAEYSDEYRYARVSVIFLLFCIIFVLANLVTSGIRVRHKIFMAKRTGEKVT